MCRGKYSRFSGDHVCMLGAAIGYHLFEMLLGAAKRKKKKKEEEETKMMERGFPQVSLGPSKASLHRVYPFNPALTNTVSAS